RRRAGGWRWGCRCTPRRRNKKTAPAEPVAASWKLAATGSADELADRLALRHQLDGPSVLRAIPGVQRNPQRVIDRRRQILRCHRAVNDELAERVGGADDLPALDAAAAHAGHARRRPVTPAG